MPDRSARIVAAGLLAIVLHAAAVAPAAAGDADRQRPERFGIRLLEIHENRLDDPRSHAFIVDHVNPGTTFTRRLEVFSTSSQRQRVSLYPGAPGPAGNIALVNRVGVRTYLDVGPGGEPPTSFRIGEVTAGRTDAGQPRLVAEVRNTGERAVDLEGEVRLSEGPSELSAGPFRGTRATTLPPGGQGQVTVLLGHDLPAGPWNFRLTLRSGRVSRTATGTITFPEAGERAAADDDPSPPVLAACALAAVAAAALLVVNLRRFRRRPLDGEAA
ncbi:hypothetical protein [Microbispora sp. NPDC046933]|uniref:hypothetical protein n=1 Tax=Microbispora sp. NPDC046933 TaxID=3155618 RepID=UPI0033CE65C9